MRKVDKEKKVDNIKKRLEKEIGYKPTGFIDKEYEYKPPKKKKGK